MKNGLTKSLLFFFVFLKIPKIWVGRTTLNGEKNGMAWQIISDFMYVSTSENSVTMTRNVVRFYPHNFSFFLYYETFTYYDSENVFKLLLQFVVV